MNTVVFLDYDGVVNTIQWKYYPRDNKFKARYAFPQDNFVNDFQAVQWLNQLYRDFPFDIVVTSTWRLDNNYKECLRAGGLDPHIIIQGKTDNIGRRDEEIKAYLLQHPEITNFIVIDDDDFDLTKYLDRLVKCDTFVGFKCREYQQALDLLKQGV